MKHIEKIRKSTKRIPTNILVNIIKLFLVKNIYVFLCVMQVQWPQSMVTVTFHVYDQNALCARLFWKESSTSAECCCLALSEMLSEKTSKQLLLDVPYANP